MDKDNEKVLGGQQAMVAQSFEARKIQEELDSIGAQILQSNDMF